MGAESSHICLSYRTTHMLYSKGQVSQSTCMNNFSSDYVAHSLQTNLTTSSGSNGVMEFAIVRGAGAVVVDCGCTACLMIGARSFASLHEAQDLSGLLRK